VPTIKKRDSMIEGGHGAYAPLPPYGSRWFDSLERDCFAHLHDEKQINARMRAI